MPSTGFFGRTPRALSYVKAPKTLQKQAFVNVGGDGDCGFRSVAAAIIANFLARPRANQELMKFLLEHHFQYFPPQQVGGRLLTPLERVQDMINTPSRLAEFIRNLAYTLRQLAVDVMGDESDEYPGAFVENNEQTSPAEMRKPGTWIDESAIDALSNALAIHVKVRKVESGKPFPQSYNYKPRPLKGDDKPRQLLGEDVVIQLQHHHYIPLVSQPKLFELVSAQPVRTVMPVVTQQKPDPTMTEIMNRIKKTDARTLDVFEHNRNRLESMVLAGELDKQNLINIYVGGLGKSDYLSGHTQHGSQQFFTELMARVKGEAPIISMGSEPYEAQVISELIHAISRAIAIGHLDAEQVYASIDDDVRMHQDALQISKDVEIEEVTQSVPPAIAI